MTGISAPSLTHQRAAALPTAGAGAYYVQVAASWGEVEAMWRALPREAFLTPFQTSDWLAAWYRTIGARSDVEPLIVIAREAVSERGVLALLLVRRRGGSLRPIEFADLGMADYNAPVTGPKLPGNASAFGGSGAMSVARCRPPTC